MSEGIMGLVGKKMTKTIKFMSQPLEISKLSVNQVLAIQEAAKSAGEDENANFDLLKEVIRMSAKGADELADDDFDSFPIDDLSKLSNEIMSFSGIGDKGNAKK